MSRGSTVRSAVAGMAAMLLLAACGPGEQASARMPSAGSVPSIESGAVAPSGPTSGPLSVAPGGVTKALTIVLENRGGAVALAGMPQVAQLAQSFGRTTRYRAVTHPSLPNYLVLAGGSTFGVRDDAPPSAHRVRGSSVFDRALAHGATARTYAESMPSNCATRSEGRYAVKHNPWAYFSDDAARRACAVDDVPLGSESAGALVDDIGAGNLPVIGLVVPDLCDDAHDCPLPVADAWVAGWVNRVVEGPDWRAGRLAVVITFDEAENHGDNSVLTVVIAPGLRGVVVDAPLTHASWTRWMCELTGSPAPGDAANAASLGGAFGL